AGETRGPPRIARIAQSGLHGRRAARIVLSGQTMAKLSDLKRLVDEARTVTSASDRPVKAVAKLTAPSPVKAAARAPLASGVARRAIAAQKHASGDLDLAKAFADVVRLPPSTRRR